MAALRYCMAIMTRPPSITIAAEPLLSPGLIRDVRVATAGHLATKRAWIHHRFGVHAVGLVVRGHGSYAVGKETPRRVGPGSLFCVYPGPVFHYGPDDGTAWEEYYVTAMGTGVRRWLQNGWLFVDGSVRNIVAKEPLIELWRELLATLQRGATGDSDRSVVIAERLLVEAYYGQADYAVPEENISRRAREYCQAHFAEDIDFEWLARSFGVSYSLLRRKMKQATGEGPAHYLTRVRCDRARSLLLRRQLSIQEIARAVGIPDPFSFSRAFKRSIGVAPHHYREQMVGR